MGINAGPLLDGDGTGEKCTKQPTYWNGYSTLVSSRSFTVTLKSTRRISRTCYIGYLALIIEARMEYTEGNGWVGYDGRFRQNAAASPDAIWARPYGIWPLLARQTS